MSENLENRPSLTDDEKEVLQILVVHHKAIIYSKSYGWMIDIVVEAHKETLCGIMIDHQLVTSLRQKNLIQRDLDGAGNVRYILTSRNDYEDIITELSVQKALGTANTKPRVPMNKIKKK